MNDSVTSAPGQSRVGRIMNRDSGVVTPEVKTEVKTAKEKIVKARVKKTAVPKKDPLQEKYDAEQKNAKPIIIDNAPIAKKIETNITRNEAIEK